MSKRIGRRGNCCGCLHLTKPLVVCKEEGSIVRQRPSDAGAELIAHEWWDRTATKIKVVLGIECGVSVQFKQRSMEVVTSGLGYCLDDATAIPAILRTEGLCQDADFGQF